MSEKCECVRYNEAIPLKENLVLSENAICHTEGSKVIVLDEEGCYLINFSASASLEKVGIVQLELRVNGIMHSIAVGEILKCGSLINLASTAIVFNSCDDELEIELVNGSKCQATFCLTRVTIVKLS